MGIYDMGIYDDEFLKNIRGELAFIEFDCDDGGGIAFAYQRILDQLHSVCTEYIDGKPSIVNEQGGI